MRIIGGALGGRRLVAPAGHNTRPTTDRVRENLFNILAHRIDLDGARVIDLFSGSGALGLEALSRGAEFCLFVEIANKAAAAIRQNLIATGMEDHGKIMRRDATRMGSVNELKPFHIAFADPPYGKGFGERAAKSLVEGGWLGDNALFILEESSTAMPSKINDFERVDARDYGTASIGIFVLRTISSI